MQVAAIAKILDDAVVSGNPDTAISSIAYDSRAARAGGLFVALRGGYVDGHAFLEAARRSGATAAVVEPTASPDDLRGYRAVITVPNTRAALAPVSAAFFNHPSRALNVIGITGTDGKTTTSYFIDAICRAAGEVTGMIGTVEVRTGTDSDMHSSRQTTPESLLIHQYLDRMRATGATTAIVEATSHGLMLHRLDYCEFDVAVITNITHEHLDFHGTVENYRAAKGQLLRFVSASRARGKRGLVVLNLDDRGAMSVAHLAHDCQVLTFSASGRQDAPVRATRHVQTSIGSSFELEIAGESRTVSINLPGGHNIQNAAAAAATGHALGHDIDTIARGLEFLRSVPGRMEVVDEGQPFAVLVDYAHSPEAMRGILTEARRSADGRVLVLFGSAGERDIEKRSLQGAIAAELADFSVFTSEDPRFEDPQAVIDAIAGGATGAGARLGVDFECIEDRRLAIEHLIDRAQPGDVVVLAGKGHERSMIYGNEFRPWNEAEVARTALRARGHRLDSPIRDTDS